MGAVADSCVAKLISPSNMAASKGVCAVVGCGPGMGGAAAIKFAKEGFKIAAMTRSVESFAPTEEKLAALGATYKHFPMDCTDAAAVTAAFTAAEQEFGCVTVLVYNTGGGGFGIPVLQIDPETFMQSFNMSCVGALLCTQAVLPGMIAREGGDGKDSHRVKKKGTIIFSSATSAFRGSAGTAQFAAGKFALRALSQSIAKEHSKDGVHVCHVRLDCQLDTYATRNPEAHAANKFAITEDIAETYYSIHEQSLMGMSNEIDIRPFQEGWS